MAPVWHGVAQRSLGPIARLVAIGQRSGADLRSASWTAIFVRRGRRAGMTKISCLMVTLPVPERRAGLRRAIAAFAAQTCGPRELVVVIDQGEAENRAAVIAELGALPPDQVRIVMPERPMPLGALRNLSVAAAAGEVVCQWDDDDLHHPERLAVQLRELETRGCPALMLEDVMLLREPEGQLFWLHWSRTDLGGHPATLMARRDAMPGYPETGPTSLRDEDTAVVKRLRVHDRVEVVAGQPHLYVYVTHGLNWSAAAHHASLLELSISTGLLRRREAALRSGLAPFGFPAGRVQLHGSGGPAFTLG